MKEKNDIASPSPLTPAAAQDILNMCLDLDTDEGLVYNYLMSLIRALRERISGYTEETERLQSSLNIAKRISNRLRKKAQSDSAIRYFYYGVYQAKLDQLQEELITQKVKLKQQETSSRKHFAAIMQILYAQQMARQSELSKQLSMDRANLSREMDRLVLAGFVEQRKAGKFKLYNLSAQGYSYYNEYLLLQSRLEPPRPLSGRQRSNFRMDFIIQYEKRPSHYYLIKLGEGTKRDQFIKIKDSYIMTQEDYDVLNGRCHTEYALGLMEG